MDRKKIGYERHAGQENSLLDALNLTQTFVDKTHLKGDVRPNLIKALQVVDEHTDVFVPSFISLATSLSQLKAIITKIISLGGTITFMKESITITSASEIELKLISSMADFERDVRSFGIRTAIKSGKTVGRKKTLSAAEQEKVIQRIKDRENIQKLADEYRVSRTTLYKYVQDLDWWIALQNKRKRPPSKVDDPQSKQSKSKKPRGKRKLTFLSEEQQAEAIQRIKDQENIKTLSAEYKVSRTTLYKLVKDQDWWKAVQGKRGRTIQS